MSTKILIVDDEVDLCEMVQRTLHKQPDFDAMICSNPQDVMDMCLEFEPGLILLDVVMPEMNGVEIVEQLQSNSKTQKIKIIVTSGLGEMTYKDRPHPWKWEPNRSVVRNRDRVIDESSSEHAAKKYGVARYLKKPFSPSALLQVIREVLNQKDADE